MSLFELSVSDFIFLSFSRGVFSCYTNVLLRLMTIFNCSSCEAIHNPALARHISTRYQSRIPTSHHIHGINSLTPYTLDFAWVEKFSTVNYLLWLYCRNSIKKKKKRKEKKHSSKNYFSTQVFFHHTHSSPSHNIPT